MNINTELLSTYNAVFSVLITQTTSKDHGANQSLESASPKKGFQKADYELL